MIARNRLLRALSSSVKHIDVNQEQLLKNVSAAFDEVEATLEAPGCIRKSMERGQEAVNKATAHELAGPDAGRYQNVKSNEIPKQWPQSATQKERPQAQSKANQDLRVNLGSSSHIREPSTFHSFNQASNPTLVSMEPDLWTWSTAKEIAWNPPAPSSKARATPARNSNPGSSGRETKAFVKGVCVGTALAPCLLIWIWALSYSTF